MENETTSTKRGKSGMKTLLILVVALIVVVVGGYLAYSKGLISVGAQQGKTVATVNGTPIYEREITIRYNQLKDAYAQQGANLSDANTVDAIKKQIVQEAVNEELVLQDATKQNITTTDAEVKSSVDQLIATAGSKDALDKQMKQFGMNQTDLEKTVRRNLVLQKYVEQYTAKQNVTVTEAEITAAYTAMAQGQPASTTPALKDVHTQVEQQVRNQKLAQIILALVNQLKQNADVKIL